MLCLKCLFKTKFEKFETNYKALQVLKYLLIFISTHNFLSDSH
jgi:hypothetical protein